MKRPNFMVLGAAKSGTTSLCLLLETHPDVYLSDPKEPVFFELLYERGLQYYLDTYYTGWNGERAAGEGRVYNLYLPYVPPRIRKTLPDARLIIILREPVERAYSHWWHRVTRGYETRSFKEAVEHELERLEAGGSFRLKFTQPLWRTNFHRGAQRLHTADLREVPYVEMGHYAEQVTRYLDLFPHEQIKVILLEDLQRDRDGVVREVWDFIGVDDTQEVPDMPPSNVALDEVKSDIAFRLERLSWSLRINDRLPKWLKAAARSLLPSTPASRPVLEEEQRVLLQEHFSPWNDRLGALLSRSMESWAPRGVGSRLTGPDAG